MIFAAPWALAGLVFAAVPVLLHLVQRRDPPERSFPAIQYLSDATRDHRRRLRLRHWLLLLCRTVLILALVLAAAGPQARRSVPFARHAPTSVVLVLDNSASSAAVVDGTPILDRLVERAREVLSRATVADRIWLILADGVARPGSASEFTARLDAVSAASSHFDLGAAIAQGAELIRNSGRAGEVIVITDAQRSAIAPVSDDVPVLVLRPEEAPPGNRSVASVDAGAQPWGPGGGRLDLVVQGSDTAAVPLRVEIDRGSPRDLLVNPGFPASIRLPSLPPGWRTVRALLPPDELRADDERWLALRVAPPAAVEWDRSDRFVAAALDVLANAGRVRVGTGVRIGTLGPGPSIVWPPSDPALIGALNRELAARGSSWRFGTTSAVAETTDSNEVLPDRVRLHRRVALEPVNEDAEVLATATGSPWLVRSGNIVLLGSRPDPEWTELPLRASFVPLLDRLATRTVRGEPVAAELVAGAPTTLPPRVSRIVTGDGEAITVEGGAPWSPPQPGLYWLMAAADTIGAVSAGIDPRESDLTRATDRELRAAWPGAAVASLADGAARSFTSGGRGDLRPLLLVLALLCLLGESILAGSRPRSN
jgi:hypothetical protein